MIPFLRLRFPVFLSAPVKAAVNFAKTLELAGIRSLSVAALRAAGCKVWWCSGRAIRDEGATSSWLETLAGTVVLLEAAVSKLAQ